MCSRQADPILRTSDTCEFPPVRGPNPQSRPVHPGWPKPHLQCASLSPVPKISDSNFHFQMPLALLDLQQIRTTRSIQKNAIKHSVKIRFWTFLPIRNTRCCIRSPAWPTYSTPNGTRVRTPGATFRDFRGERAAVTGQSQPCTFRSCGAESRLSASRWCLRNPPQASGPLSFQRIGDN
jgi:hypothetical protein